MKGQPDDILVVTDLTKTYGQLQAVDGLSFTARTGEVLGISGPNGAGKTTMFDLISGVTPATSGQIEFDGKPIHGLSPDRICHAGLVRTFQMNASFDGLSILEAVLVGSIYGRRRTGVGTFLGVDRVALQRAEHALETVGLADRRHVLSADATVFEAKRAMIACAIATGPKLLMMDEPVGGLVPSEIEQITELVRDLKQTGVTIVLIEHVMRFLTALSDRILVMHHGRHLFSGSPADMMKDADVRAVYLGETEAVDA